MGIKHKLSVAGFSLASAVLGAVVFTFLSISAMLGSGVEIVKIVSGLFVGFDASAAGLFVGMVWGFFLGGISGMFLAWVYNKML